jgi:hypothetical protein
MVAFLKRCHLKWLVLVAGGLLLGSVLLLVLALGRENFALVGLAILTGVAALVLVGYRNSAAARYDPNVGDPQERIQLARSLAFLSQEDQRSSDE